MSPFSKFVRRFRSPPQAVPSRTLAIPYTRLSLAEWCASGDRVTYVQSLLKDPMFLDLVAMLSNIRPIHRGPVDSTTSAMLLGQRIGHDQVIASLLAAGTPAPKPIDEIPADYNAANVEALWEKEADL